MSLPSVDGSQTVEFADPECTFSETRAKTRLCGRIAFHHGEMTGEYHQADAGHVPDTLDTGARPFRHKCVAWPQVARYKRPGCRDMVRGLAANNNATPFLGTNPEVRLLTRHHAWGAVSGATKAPCFSHIFRILRTRQRRRPSHAHTSTNPDTQDARWSGGTGR